MITNAVWLDEERRRTELDLDVSMKEMSDMGDGLFESAVVDHLNDIMCYTREDIGVVINKINCALYSAESLWDSLIRSSNGVTLFHSSTDRKIYSLTGTVDYLAVIREKVLRRIKKTSTVLDFGGSHGHISIAMARAGHKVTYADIGDTVREFAKWRFKQHRLNINITPVIDNKCSLGKYDYIFFLDVASHLPNLKGYVRELYDALNDGGELFFGDDLYDFKVGWHLEENKVYQDIYKKLELFKDFSIKEQLWANCIVLGK